jgi:hypothetical protein
MTFSLGDEPLAIGNQCLNDPAQQKSAQGDDIEGMHGRHGEQPFYQKSLDGSGHQYLVGLHIDYLHPPAHHEKTALTTSGAGFGKLKMIPPFPTQPSLQIPARPESLQDHRIVQQLHLTTPAGLSAELSRPFPGTQTLYPEP